jgi:1-acyl-sn-glycerol-3-phosphate acyltransferase
MNVVSVSRGTLKFILMLGLFLAFIAEGLMREIWARFFGISKFELHRSQCDSISRYSRRALRLLDIRVQSNVPGPVSPGLWVGNHLSYVDVLVIASVFPASFVTSVEVRNTPVLGWITRLAGCTHVERRSRDHLEQETRELRVILQSGIPLVLFPEGTSSSGREVLPFRPALFQSAVDSGASTHAFYLLHRHPEIAYHGDHEFFPHLWVLCQRDGFTVSDFIFIESIDSRAEDRKSLAARCHSAVKSTHASLTRAPESASSHLEPDRVGQVSSRSARG